MPLVIAWEEIVLTVIAAGALVGTVAALMTTFGVFPVTAHICTGLLTSVYWYRGRVATKCAFLGIFAPLYMVMLDQHDHEMRMSALHQQRAVARKLGVMNGQIAKIHDMTKNTQHRLHEFIVTIGPAVDRVVAANEYDLLRTDMTGERIVPRMKP